MGGGNGCTLTDSIVSRPEGMPRLALGRAPDAGRAWQDTPASLAQEGHTVEGGGAGGYWFSPCRRRKALGVAQGPGGWSGRKGRRRRRLPGGEMRIRLASAH